MRDILGGDARAGARLVVDHELLAEDRRRGLRVHARHDIGGRAGREPDDDVDRPRRIGVKRCGNARAWTRNRSTGACRTPTRPRRTRSWPATEPAAARQRYEAAIAQAAIRIEAASALVGSSAARTQLPASGRRASTSTWAPSSISGPPALCGRPCGRSRRRPDERDAGRELDGRCQRAFTGAADSHERAHPRHSDGTR